MNPVTEILPARDTEAEQVVLGCLLDDAGLIHELRGRLAPEAFGLELHRLIYSAMLDLADEGEPVNPLTVKNLLIRGGRLDALSMDEGGLAGMLVELHGFSGFAGHLSHYLGELRTQQRRRALQMLAHRIGRDAQTDADPVELAGRYQQQLVELVSESNDGDGTVSFAQAAHEAINHARDVAEGKVEPGLMTGFRDIDAATGGWQPGDLIVLAADTGAGKTTLASCIGLNVARSGSSVLLVSREMRPRELGRRLIQAAGNISGAGLRPPLVYALEADSWAALDRAAGELAGLRASIDARSRTVAEIGSRARRLAGEWGGLNLIVVDYLQLLDGKGDTRAQVVGGIAWQLKELAMGLPAVVLLLSQFDRATNRAKADKPTIHSLKESGDVENHANGIILLWRPDPPVSPSPGSFEIWAQIGKNRDGRTTPWEGGGAIRLWWEPSTTRFIEPACRQAGHA